jgi:hypothetical protein
MALVRQRMQQLADTSHSVPSMGPIPMGLQESRDMGGDHGTTVPAYV